MLNQPVPPFFSFKNCSDYSALRAFDHICMEKARYKFLIVVIIIVICRQTF